MPDLTEQLALPVALEVFFQLNGAIEMVFDGALASAGDDDNVFDAGGDRLFHRILNERLVHQGKHFLGRRLSRWKKPRPEARGGKNGFTNLSTRHRAIVCDGVGDVKESPTSPTRSVAGVDPAQFGFTLKHLPHIIREFFTQVRG